MACCANDAWQAQWSDEDRRPGVVLPRRRLSNDRETALRSLENGELQLELTAAAAPATVDDLFARSPAARRTLHDVRLRAGLILVAALVVAAAFNDTLTSVVTGAVLFALVWTFSTHAAERSLRTVRVVAGRGGEAAFAAIGGLGIGSAAAFWLHPRGSGEEQLIVMALLVFGILLVLDVAKVRFSILRSRILLVGGRQDASDVIEVLAQDRRRPFTAVGVVEDEPTTTTIAGIEVLGAVRDLRRIATEVSPGLGVVTATRGRPEVFAGLGSVAGLGFRVVGLPEFYEHAFGRVPIRRMTDAWFMSVLHLYQRSYSRTSKRAFDITVATFALLLTAPLFPLIALLVKRTRGPIFYGQTRLGEQGRPFRILKFRTMRMDAETAGAVWAQQGDPRTTQVGRLLRKTRLDEIPQLINVLRGEMSIVGPRPERPEFLGLLEENVPFWSRRHLLRPGITGWAQLRAGYTADAVATEEKLSYDLWYLRHQSLIVDVLICARTLPSLLLCAGR
jgi:exopolysaccharide biosynthesis polyprenyl glycosylphosphotransferase